MATHTVLLISSDHVGWVALRALLATMPDVQIIGDTADLQQALDLAAAADPDVIIADAVAGGVAAPPRLADLRRGGGLLSADEAGDGPPRPEPVKQRLQRRRRGQR